MAASNNLPLLTFIAESSRENRSIPSIADLSQELGISTASVREQLEVLKQMGFVDVKPKTGIQARAFSLTKPVLLAMKYGLKLDQDLFLNFSELRRHLESSFWYESVPKLRASDMDCLQAIIKVAEQKINGDPIQVPMNEHRDFHMRFFKPLENRIVVDLMEAYWELNHQSNMSLYRNHDYLVGVWTYHQNMLDAVKKREFELGHQLLLTHMDLVQQVRKTVPTHRFE